MTEDQRAAIVMVATEDMGMDAEDVEIVETAETLADFEDSRKSWADAGEADASDEPIRHVLYSRVRMAKGQQKQQFCVFDLGEKRAVVKY